MVHHIVMWNVKDEVEDKLGAMQHVKELLEALHDEVPGILSISVTINEMESSNRDIALISSFETKEALQAYQVSDGDVAAGKYVRSVLTDRACLDYEV